MPPDCGHLQCTGASKCALAVRCGAADILQRGVNKCGSDLHFPPGTAPEDREVWVKMCTDGTDMGARTKWPAVASALTVINDPTCSRPKRTLVSRSPTPAERCL